MPSLPACDRDPRPRGSTASNAGRDEAIRAVLCDLADDEAIFSIDELGPVAVKMRSGKSLQAPGQIRVVPQWQKSRGCFILSAALELSKNQITYFFSDHKNSVETIQLLELLRRRYSKLRKLYVFWDAAPWHSFAALRDRITFLNEWAAYDQAPSLEVLPLPSRAQFLSVIESVFSGMARAVLQGPEIPLSLLPREAGTAATA